MDGKDNQFSSEPIVQRTGECQFFVSNLLKYPSGPNWTYPLYIECEYCHKELKVTLSAPNNIPQFVQDEARRLGVLHHLRTEHTKRQVSDKTAN